MNILTYNIARSIRMETDEQKLHTLLLNNKKYISDNVYELLTLLGPQFISKIFCVLCLKDIKFVCMNIQDPRLLQYVPEKYCSDILKLFRSITSRDELTKMYSKLYCYIPDERLRKRLFYIILKDFTPNIITELDKDADKMTDDEFLLLYKKHKKTIKRKSSLLDIKNLCFKFERLFSNIDSELFYSELIKHNDLVDNVANGINGINGDYKNLKQSTYNKIKAYVILKDIRQEVM